MLPKHQVNITCIIDEQYPIEYCVGDWVFVHVSFALNRLDQSEAAETLQLSSSITI